MDVRSRPESAGILLVTELFPPTVGGSAELFANTYSRVKSVDTIVLTDVSNGSRRDGAGPLVQEATMRTAHWGLLHPGGLAHHVRIAARIRQVSRAGIAAIHCGRVLPEGLSALLARGTGSPPYLCWAHGEELATAQSSRELNWLAVRVYRNARGILANSRNTAEIVHRTGVPRGAIHVVYPGVDVDRFQPQKAGCEALRKELAPHGETICLTVGRLQRRKGHDLVIEALAGIPPEARSLRYVIVGDGEERPRLAALVETLGLTETVTFRGRIDADELPRYYAASDIFVHPNRLDGTDFEGFGIVFLEAAAAGLPAIGGRSGGVPEAVLDGSTGLLVTGTDVAELRNALALLAQNPQMRRTIGETARRRVAAEFTWQSAAERLSTVHHEVTATSSSGRSRRSGAHGRGR
jgi:phosphatidylinositol alpha-1,6-mannosyltransferase